MPTDDSALVFYLIVLLVVVGSFFFGDFRNRFSRLVQQALIWMLIFATVTLLFSFRDELGAGFAPRTTVQTEGETIVLTRSRDGHFYATLEINGVDIRFVVDTGATHVVLNKRDADAIGLDVENLIYLGRASTANGQVRTARVRLKEVNFGKQTDRNLSATVNEGQLDTSLLGMTYLNRFSKIEIARNKMRLVP